MLKTERTLSLTIELPESMVQLLKHMAQLTQQSLSELAAQSIKGNLPPTIDNAPLEIQADLLAMQRLANEELLKIAHSQIPQPQQQRHLALLENQANLTLAERQELSHLRHNADQLTLRKAYAWSLLRWRGQHLPLFNQLPLESV